jgi:uncharacterized protein with PQ loop repeat
MHLVTDAVGFLASLASFLVLVPQAVRVRRDRHDPAALAAVSVPTQAMLLTNSLLWAVYALLIGSLWVGAPVVVNAPITATTIVLALRARRTLAACSVVAASAASAGAGFVASAVAVADAGQEPRVVLAARELVAAA